MFLEKVLPRTGRYMAAAACPAPPDKGGPKRLWWTHRSFDSIEKAMAYLLAMEEKGYTAYMAQATFKEEATSRNRAQVEALRSFFVDIDCGPDDPRKHPDQRAAALALKAFIAEAKLPAPAVVSSGGGLYAYWAMDEDMPPSVWQVVAVLLKKVMAAYGFIHDPTRTADMVGVLRPPGSHNNKPHVGGREVTALTPVEPHRLEDFVALLEAAAKRRSVSTNISAPAKAGSEWDDYSIYQPIPSYPEKIADKCGQIRVMRDTKGDLPEPQWYAAIGVLRHTEGGDQIIQEWSSGHADYTPEATEAKILQHEKSGAGPTTCAFFGGLDPKPCFGCKYKDKITSPIVLGRPDVVQAPPPAPEICQPNPPFIRSEAGLFVQEGDLQVKFYDLDLYPIRVAYDESLNYEVVTFRHHLPHDGEHEFTLRSSLVNDPRSLLTALWDNHVHVIGKKEKAIMVNYIESYTQKLQRQRKMSRLLCQMGWRETNTGYAFVLGKNIFYSDGTSEQANLANNIPAAAAAYEAVGTLDAWVEATRPFDAPGAEPYAFALLAGAFGAPLMRFTGYEGALVSLVGKSGIGKTLVSRMIQSTYGHHTRLMMLRDDTRNSLMSRLGVYGSLPLTIDEVTNIEGPELSDLVYRITQGRDKARLTKNSVEKANLNQWNTVAVVSSNASLVEKLSGHKMDASAEINRIFEYYLYANPALDRQTCTAIYRTIDQNYGHAGIEYVKYLVTHTDEHQQKMDQLAELIEQKASIGSDDRFWGAILAAAIYGGTIAHHLGLIKFDVSRVLKWGIKQLINMKVSRTDLAVDAISALGLYLDEHVQQRLIVEVGNNPKAVKNVIDEPRGRSLNIRIETDQRRAYVSRDSFKTWLTKRHGNYDAIRDELLRLSVLINPNKRKVLGSGTGLASAVVPCWEIDLENPNIGQVGAAIKTEAELLARAKEE